MDRPFWRGVAVIYSSALGKEAAAEVAKAVEALGAPAHIFQYRQLEEVWGCYDAYIFVMAMGGVIRALCGRLMGKEVDPPVLVVTHDVKYIVPVLGMHRGANKLATRLAQVLDSTPVVSTAAEIAGFAPLEDVERLLLCELSPVDKLRAYKALTSGEEVCIDADVHPPPGYSKGSHCAVVIKRGCVGEFCCRPWRLYVGFGATSRATVDDVVAAVMEAMADLKAQAVEAVASIKPIVYQVAEALGVRAVYLKPEELIEGRCLSPPSQLAEIRVGVGNVAERAALTAAGPGGELIYRKRAFFKKVTVAVARV
ncbi:MAG: cobalamin biosynthesis protein [Pyrobaculum sp.]